MSRIRELKFDLETTRVREMREVVDEARAREQVAVRNGRLADAALYREIGDRAAEVASRESELGYARRTVAEDEARRERETLDRAADRAQLRRRLGRAVRWTVLALVLGALGGLSVSCTTTMPPIMAGASGTVELGAGVEVPSGRGSPDIGDVGPYPVVRLSGAIAEGDKMTGAAGEWFLSYGHASAEDVDAGDLGLFDLEADIARLGAGLRLGTLRAVGMDWSLGLGAVVTIVHGEATAGPDFSRDISEGGVGAYATLRGARGPLYLEVGYIDGPGAEVDGEEVELGGLGVVGGLRWVF